MPADLRRWAWWGLKKRDTGWALPRVASARVGLVVLLRRESCQAPSEG